MFKLVAEFLAGLLCYRDVVSGSIIGVIGNVGNGLPQTIRTRFTIAQVNAGATVLAAIPGYKYRLIDLTLIAIGGNAATATAVTISGTQAASVVALVSAAIAALTRSAFVKPNTANVTILADGASFATCDENTAITIEKTGSALATATHVDVIATFVIEKS